MLIIVYQTNTGHPAVSLYNEFNAQNKFTFKCWSCPAFNVVHQLSCFCALCFAIFADEVVLLIFILQTFSWNHSPIYFVCSSLSSLLLFLSCTGHFPHLKYFEASASLCVVNGILLDIGRNLQACPWEWDSLGNVPWDGMGQQTFVFPMRLGNRMRVSECYLIVVVLHVSLYM